MPLQSPRLSPLEHRRRTDNVQVYPLLTRRHTCAEANIRVTNGKHVIITSEIRARERAISRCDAADQRRIVVALRAFLVVNVLKRSPVPWAVSLGVRVLLGNASVTKGQLGAVECPTASIRLGLFENHSRVRLRIRVHQFDELSIVLCIRS